MPPHFRRVSGLLFAGDVEESRSRLRTRSHTARDSGKTRRHPNDRRLVSHPDGRWLILPRYTQPEPDLQLLLHHLHLELPSQPPPRITADSVPAVALAAFR